MVTIPESIQKIVYDYVKRISSKIPIQKVFLFGSYANGTFNDSSDVDIAVFSDYFKTMDRIEAFRLLFTPAMDYDIDIQPQSFTIDEYNDPVGIVEEIIKTGVEILL